MPDMAKFRHAHTTRPISHKVCDAGRTILLTSCRIVVLMRTRFSTDAKSSRWFVSAGDGLPLSPWYIDSLLGPVHLPILSATLLDQLQQCSPSFFLAVTSNTKEIQLRSLNGWQKMQPSVGGWRRSLLLLETPLLMLKPHGSKGELASLQEMQLQQKQRLKPLKEKMPSSRPNTSSKSMISCRWQLASQGVARRLRYQVDF
jgi:hypothetical protein